MERYRDTWGILDLMDVPAFCVKESHIIYANPLARELSLMPGVNIAEILATGHEEYAAYDSGCLSLALKTADTLRNAFVNRVGDCDVFTLERDSESRGAAALSLAARALREPLTGVILAAEKLLPHSPGKEAALFSRNLHRLLRLLGNMSDVSISPSESKQKTINISVHIEELMEKIHIHLTHAGVTLNYHPLQEHIFCLVNWQQLEKAILNIVSNAVKYSEKGASIEASLARQGRLLYLSITDHGCGIPENILPTVYSRYTRHLGIEDSRNGIGLGMPLILNAAQCHGGTVLIDHPQEGGTRVTITIAIRQDSGNTLHAPMLAADYGGWDFALTELSDCLPPHIYDPN